MRLDERGVLLVVHEHGAQHRAGVRHGHVHALLVLEHVDAVDDGEGARAAVGGEDLAAVVGVEERHDLGPVATAGRGADRDPGERLEAGPGGGGGDRGGDRVHRAPGPVHDVLVDARRSGRGRARRRGDGERDREGRRGAGEAADHEVLLPGAGVPTS